MKKTLPLLTLLAVSVALPAFADNHNVKPAETTTTYVERTVYKTKPIKVPLSPEQVAERQRVGTWLGGQIKKIDTNNDRHINRDEFAYGGHVFNLDADIKDPETFRKIDTNSDGKLSQHELLLFIVKDKEKAAASTTIVYDQEDVVRVTTPATR